MKVVWESLRMLLWMTILTGLLYPVLITGIAKVFFNDAASGSILEIDNKPRGSKLIAQKFTSDRYFWPRPSTVDYNALSSGGSNLGPTSAELKKQVDERRQSLAKKSGVDPAKVPDELLFASGSGLDPHITLEAAYFQLDRVAKARSMDPETIRKAIDHLTETQPLRLLGKTRINVLMLNQYLDQINQAKNKHG